VIASDGLTGSFGSRGDFHLLVQALGQSSRANLLSTPSITTLDNQAAEIVVGQNVPFRTGSYATDGNTTTPFTTIERADVGLTLRVVPRVHDGETVRLFIPLADGMKVEFSGTVANHVFEIGFGLKFDQLSAAQRDVLGQLVRATNP